MYNKNKNRPKRKVQEYSFQQRIKVVFNEISTIGTLSEVN